MEIICGHCSHTCESCSLTDLCKECITTFPLTDDGKTQCIECAPPESDYEEGETLEKWLSTIGV